MSKTLLIIKDGVVSYARVFDEIWLSKTTNTFPYRTNDAAGNPYARALRQRDHNRNRGSAVDVILIDDTDVRNYLYKNYNPSNGDFFLVGMTEEERQEKIDEIETFFGIYHDDYDTIQYCNPPYDIVKNIVSEDFFDKISDRIRKHEAFSEEEVAQINDYLSQMDKEKRNRFIYTIATHYTRVCLDPPVGADPVDRDQEYIKNNSEIAVSWWNRLKGTEKEKKALFEIARIYSWSSMEDDASRIYKDMLKRKDLNNYEKDKINRSIRVLGSGREYFNECVKEFDSGNVEKCLLLLDDCKKNISGIQKKFLRQGLNELKAKCNILIAQKESSSLKKKMLKEEAERLLYPERFKTRNN